MILPSSVTVKSEMWNALAAGAARVPNGNTMNSTNAARQNAAHTGRERARCEFAALPAGFSGAKPTDMASRFNGAALERKQALRPLLDEDHDEDQNRDLGEHGARPRLEELVDDAQAERRIDSAGELADAAQHDHHERVDEIALSQIRADVADLRQRTAGTTTNPRAQAA